MLSQPFEVPINCQYQYVNSPHCLFLTENLFKHQVNWYCWQSLNLNYSIILTTYTFMSDQVVVLKGWSGAWKIHPCTCRAWKKAWCAREGLLLPLRVSLMHMAHAPYSIFIMHWIRRLRNHMNGTCTCRCWSLLRNLHRCPCTLYRFHNYRVQRTWHVQMSLKL